MEADEVPGVPIPNTEWARGGPGGGTVKRKGGGELKKEGGGS